MPSANPFHPSSPPIPPLLPGEYGRAWVESLQAHQPAQMDEMLREGTLWEEARRIEREAQQEWVETVRTWGGPPPRGMTPDEAVTAIHLQARELVLARVRVPPPPETTLEPETVIGMLGTMPSDAETPSPP
jgi:hypothetical protein